LTFHTAGVKRGKYAPATKYKLGGSYEMRIREICPNSAAVIVNEEWRARLETQDYNGPRTLIEKSSGFKAMAELYKVDGNTAHKNKRRNTETLNHSNPSRRAKQKK